MNRFFLLLRYLTACANDFCREAKRQTISAQDVMQAIKELEFGELEEPLKEYLDQVTVFPYYANVRHMYPTVCSTRSACSSAEERSCRNSAGPIISRRTSTIGRALTAYKNYYERRILDAFLR